MRIEYESKKVELQCTNIKEAKKLFGGDESMAISLLARINAICAAETLKDIIVQPKFRFHKLNGAKLNGYFAIDAKSIKEAWRIIVQPLNENSEPFVPCNIDEIADSVRVVGLKEVSHHYEQLY